MKLKPEIGKFPHFFHRSHLKVVFGKFLKFRADFWDDVMKQRSLWWLLFCFHWTVINYAFKVRYLSGFLNFISRRNFNSIFGKTQSKTYPVAILSLRQHMMKTKNSLLLHFLHSNFRWPSTKKGLRRWNCSKFKICYPKNASKAKNYHYLPQKNYIKVVPIEKTYFLW